MKGSWPDLLVVSAKCFNVQQAHLQQTQAKVKQQADRCQSLGWEDPGPSAELAWAGGWEVGSERVWGSDMIAGIEPTKQ